MRNDKLRNIDLKYFKLSEFESPDLKESGENMDLFFLLMLDQCRDLAGIPFKVTSGFRTEKHNKKIKGVLNSSHLKGLAVDISAKTSQERYKIINAAIKIGFKRIGIGKSFIHLDADKTKAQEVMWDYY
jgi:uncharacterized protein YcbK (DUF882 family)|tara:strand:+ start:670 stop:1056 length:387 start_codon:yes stop_codon:yes gene_type:complete